MTAPMFNLNIAISERAEGTVGFKPVGLNPYIHLTVDDVTDDSLDIGIEVGGGTPAEPLEDLATFLEDVSQAIRNGIEADDEAPKDES